MPAAPLPICAPASATATALHEDIVPLAEEIAVEARQKKQKV